MLTGNAGLGRTVSLISLSLTRSRLIPLHQLISGLASLMQQGISASRGAVGENGFIFRSNGFQANGAANCEATQARTTGRGRNKGVCKELQAGPQKTPTRAGA